VRRRLSLCGACCLADLKGIAAIHPGEILYFPTWWLHAVLNLDSYTSFVSSFQ